METQRSYKKRHRKHLDALWDDKYPEGAFILQRGVYPRIIIQTGRNTSWVSCGTGVTLDEDGKVVIIGSRAPGNKIIRGTLGEIITICEKYNINGELVSTFVQICEKRKERLARQEICELNNSANKTEGCFCSYRPHMNKCKKCGRSCGCYTKKES